MHLYFLHRPIKVGKMHVHVYILQRGKCQDIWSSGEQPDVIFSVYPQAIFWASAENPIGYVYCLV